MRARSIHGCTRLHIHSDTPCHAPTSLQCRGTSNLPCSYHTSDVPHHLPSTAAHAASEQSWPFAARRAHQQTRVSKACGAAKATDLTQAVEVAAVLTQRSRQHNSAYLASMPRMYLRRAQRRVQITPYTYLCPAGNIYIIYKKQSHGRQNCHQEKFPDTVSDLAPATRPEKGSSHQRCLADAHA